jgi:hypothetical protein
VPVLITARRRALGEATSMPSPIETTLTDAAKYDGKRVVVEGYLLTDSTIHCGPDSICVLWLSTEPEEDDGVTYSQPDPFVLIGIYEKYGAPYPNTLSKTMGVPKLGSQLSF